MILKRLFLLAVVAAAAVAFTDSTPAQQQTWPTCADVLAQRHAAIYPWHAPYYHTMYGEPVALVVPPTAQASTHWGWGVTNTRVLPIYHQFHRFYPGPATGGPARLRPTPVRPSDTDQFGVYYVRAPW